MTYFTKTYDEAFINENSVRTNYKKLISWYKNQDNNELTKINSDAMKFFENTGVSFKVYSSDKKEKSNTVWYNPKNNQLQGMG